MTGDPPKTASRGLVLLEKIGQGGFGEVFRARLETPGGLTRHVAVKLLLDDAVDDSMIARMTDEAHLLAALDHPVVLGVEDLVQVDGRSAIISEFVDGFDLGEVLPVPPGAAVRVIAKVAEALHSAWASPGPDGTPMHIVHRDIKPSNIRIGRGGVVKLLDFGIARAGTGTRRVKTKTGVVIGSLGYFAPERWSGVEDGHPADVYALGCVLIEAVTGSPALRDLTAAHQIGLSYDTMSHDDHVAWLLDRCPDHADLRALIAAMMAHKADDRPSAGEVAVTAHRLAGNLEGDLFTWSNTFQSRTSADWSTAEGNRLTEHNGAFRTTESTDLTLPVPEPEPPPSSRPRPPRTAAAIAGAGALVVVLALVTVVGVGIGAGIWASGVFRPAGEASIAADEVAAWDGAGSAPATVDLDAQADSTDAIAELSQPEPTAAELGVAVPGELPSTVLTDATPPVVRPAGSADSAVRPVRTLSDTATGRTPSTQPAATDQTPSAEPGSGTTSAPGTSQPSTSEPRTSEPSATPAGTARPAATTNQPTVPIRVVGGVPVRLRGAKGIVAIDAATPGTYTLEASFADGVWRDMGPIHVQADAPTVVKCVARFRACSIEGQ